MSPYEFEVAISCLSKDTPLAQQIHDRIAETVQPIFFYTDNQKDLVGEEGVARFTSIFASQSRVLVIVYSEGWGETPWTRVEDLAIKQVLMKSGGWRRILVYSRDNGRPGWVPETQIHGNEGLTDLGDFAAVVKAKVKEEGGVIGLEDPLEMAARVKRETELAKRREELRATAKARTAVEVEFTTIQSRLESLAAEVDSSSPGTISVQRVAGIPTNSLVMSEVLLAIFWQPDTSMGVREGELQILISQQTPALYFAWKNSTARAVNRYRFFVAEDEVTWYWEESDGSRHSSREVADRAFRSLLQAQSLREKQKIDRLRGAGRPGFR